MLKILLYLICMCVVYDEGNPYILEIQQETETKIFINAFDLNDWKFNFDFMLKTTVKSENADIYMCMCLYTDADRKPDAPTH